MLGGIPTNPISVLVEVREGVSLVYSVSISGIRQNSLPLVQE